MGLCSVDINCHVSYNSKNLQTNSASNEELISQRSIYITKYNAAIKHNAVGKCTMTGKGVCGTALHF